MRVFSLGFLVFLVCAFFSRWFFICEIRHLCDADSPAMTRPATLNLEFGGKAVLQGFEQLAFRKSNFSPELSSNNTNFITRVAEYLQVSPDVNMILTGRFLEAEKNAHSGIFENLGIARAVSIEKILEGRGIDEKRVSIDYQLMKGDILEEPVSFELYRVDTSATLPFEKLQFSFHDNTFSDTNFEYNSDVFKPGPQCLVYADSVVKYLAQHPEMKLSIIGHTDTIGSEEYNFELGLKRAQSAAKYFQSLGLKSIIQVSSQGETKPIIVQGDSTEMRKNRRVNFRIQKRT